MRKLVLGLTPEQIAKRCNSIGGSDANILASGNVERIRKLYLEKTGQKAPDNLDDILPVQMGSWTEELNRYWYERVTGNVVTNEGKEAASLSSPWRTATLDGLVEFDEAAVFEAKHVSAFAKEDEITQRYMPQLHHNMEVTDCISAVLSVFYGTMKYEHYLIKHDEEYAVALFALELTFWDWVQGGPEPTEWAMPEPLAPITAFRTEDMTGNNEWASHAGLWLENKDPAKLFETAAKDIKALTEADVGLAAGHGIQIKRSKNGALKITKEKVDE